jgi:hypothetical protein
MDEQDETPIAHQADSDAETAAEDAAAAEDECRRQHELDALRIGRVARQRQAATRAASYCLVAAAACAVMAVDLIWRAWRRYERLDELLRPAFYLLAAAALVCAVPPALQRAAALRREARRRELPEPTAEPDFSALSDGSQIVRNLEKMS